MEEGESLSPLLSPALLPRPTKRKKRPPDTQANAFLGKDLDYEGWKQIGKCENMKL